MNNYSGSLEVREFSFLGRPYMSTMSSPTQSICQFDDTEKLVHCQMMKGLQK